MKLYLTRHGRTNYNEKGLTSGWDDAVLTDEGKAQAKKIGQRLEKNPPTPGKIYCSTLQRAIDTATIIQSVCGGQIIKRDELKEKNLGVLQGIPEEEYQAHMKQVVGDVNLYRPVQGESRDDVKQRVNKILAEIIGQSANETVLIVGHHSVNRAILSQCLGGDPSSYTQRNCSLSLLEYLGGIWRAVFIDDISHLQA